MLCVLFSLRFNTVESSREMIVLVVLRDYLLNKRNNYKAGVGLEYKNVSSVYS